MAVLAPVADLVATIIDRRKAARRAARLLKPEEELAELLILTWELIDRARRIERHLSGVHAVSVLVAARQLEALVEMLIEQAFKGGLNGLLRRLGEVADGA